MVTRFVKRFSQWARSRRARIFKDYLAPSEDDRILDLGGGSGSHLARIIPYRTNVYIADINSEQLKHGKSQFGFNTVLLEESSELPFPDDYFDIIFCSSVIEHATVRKEDVKKFQTNHKFFEAAHERQCQFADEIRRVGKRYFVQTPNKYFPIESHTWLPVVIVFMPRRWQITTIDFLNKWWPKKTSPDWKLLTVQDMKLLFPEAEIAVEKVLGFTKSIMAIKK